MAILQHRDIGACADAFVAPGCDVAQSRRAAASRASKRVQSRGLWDLRDRHGDWSSHDRHRLEHFRCGNNRGFWPRPPTREAVSCASRRSVRNSDRRGSSGRLGLKRSTRAPPPQAGEDQRRGLSRARAQDENEWPVSADSFRDYSGKLVVARCHNGMEETGWLSGALQLFVRAELGLIPPSQQRLMLNGNACTGSPRARALSEPCRLDWERSD